jgi:hypothetical protein
MDEKAFRKGHNYLTLVNDLRGSRVRYVAEDREQKVWMDSGERRPRNKEPARNIFSGGISGRFVADGSP